MLYQSCKASVTRFSCGILRTFAWLMAPIHLYQLKGNTQYGSRAGTVIGPDGCVRMYPMIDMDRSQLP
jgi:hypothetical protein